MRTALSVGSRRLIVTADDFGLSPQVDAGILEAFRRGVVRSTALLVNFPDVSDSIARLREAPGLEIGIHLNLTAGPPVLPIGCVPSLVGPDGAFHNFTTFFERVARSRVDWDEVALEWNAQFERGHELGCHFSYLTSHQHVHMLPQATKVCMEIARRRSVRAVRLASFRLADMLRPLRFKGIALAPFVPVVRKILRRNDVLFNDTILEIPPGDLDWAVGRLCAIFQRLREGVHELVCHPGYVDSLLKARDPYVMERPTELAVLVDRRLGEQLQAIGIQLTTFQELTDCKGSNARSHSQNHSTESHPHHETAQR